MTSGPEAERRRQPQRVQPGDVNAVSECRLVRLFPSPFGPVKKEHPGGGYQQDGCRKARVRVCFLPNHLVKSRREAERDGGQCDWPQHRQGGWCLRSLTGGQVRPTAGRCRVGLAPTEGRFQARSAPSEYGGPPVARVTDARGRPPPPRIANRSFPHLQPSVSTNSQGSPGGDL
jgi:hypothetical protein